MSADAGIYALDPGRTRALVASVAVGVVTRDTQTHSADGCAGVVVRHGVPSQGPTVRILAAGFSRVERARMPRAVVPAALHALSAATRIRACPGNRRVRGCLAQVSNIGEKQGAFTYLGDMELAEFGATINYAETGRSAIGADALLRILPPLGLNIAPTRSVAGRPVDCNQPSEIDALLTECANRQHDHSIGSGVRRASSRHDDEGHRLTGGLCIDPMADRNEVRGRLVDLGMAQLHLNSNPPPVWKLDDDVRFKSRLVSVVIGARVEGLGEHTDVAQNGTLEEETEPFEISKQPTSVGANGSHCQRRVGALFESLVTQTVRVYADALHATTAHLRTKDGAREIDLIVEGSDGRVIAIEVKLASTVSNHDVRHLNWLETKLGEKLADRLVITTGPVAYRRPDGVAVVPLALLGP